MKETDWNDDSDLLFSDFEDIYFLDLRDDELNILVSTNELLSNAMKAFVGLEFADSSRAFDAAKVTELMLPSELLKNL